jgi:hypothetical protein
MPRDRISRMAQIAKQHPTWSMQQIDEHLNQEKRVIVFALKNFDDGKGRPIATLDNVDTFERALVERCLRKLLQSPNTPAQVVIRVVPDRETSARRSAGVDARRQAHVIYQRAGSHHHRSQYRFDIRAIGSDFGRCGH